MRMQFSLAIVALLSFAAAACRSIPPMTSASRDCNPDVSPTRLCSADGAVVVQAVDDRRILVAIDTHGDQQPDGLVDQLFLYTASEPFEFRTGAQPFSGHIEYTGGVLRVIGKDGRQPLLFVVQPAASESLAQFDTRSARLFDRSIGLSHYTGWHGLRVARLNSLRPSARCDGSPGACVEVDGIHIEFPA
jgi:hypothetical protein